MAHVQCFRLNHIWSQVIASLCCSTWRLDTWFQKWPELTGSKTIQLMSHKKSMVVAVLKFMSKVALCTKSAQTFEKEPTTVKSVARSHGAFATLGQVTCTYGQPDPGFHGNDTIVVDVVVEDMREALKDVEEYNIARLPTGWPGLSADLTPCFHIDDHLEWVYLGQSVQESFYHSNVRSSLCRLTRHSWRWVDD